MGFRKETLSFSGPMLQECTSKLPIWVKWFDSFQGSADATCFRGWDQKLKKDENPQKEAYVLFHYGEIAPTRSKITPEDCEWCPNNNIMNNPYEKTDHKYTLVTTQREYFEDSEYYPSPNDTVYRLHFNTNFAPSPSFDGVPFSYPAEPFSTNGLQSHCMQRAPCLNRYDKSCRCTNSVKIPLGMALSIFFVPKREK